MKRDGFWLHVEVDGPDGCWLWTGSQTSGGYGNARWDGGYDYAHRIAYRELRGPIPEGLVLDHLCRVRHCVNPSHLEPVAQVENVRRGAVPLRVACQRGHDTTRPENVRIDGRGHRRCRVCVSIYNKGRRRAA